MVDKVKSQKQMTSTPNVFGINRKGVKKVLEMSPIKEPVFPVSKKTPMMKLVVQAIKAVGLPKRGASLIAIKKWIEANSDNSHKNQTLFLKKAILKAIESGEIVRAHHSANARGVTGCFIVPPISKNVKNTPTKIVTEKRIAKLPKMNEKVSKAPKNLKEQKTKQNVKAVKKTYNKKIRSSPLKGTTEKKLNHTSPHRNVSKKGTNRNPHTVSLRISSKASKSAVPPPKLAVKKAMKKKSPSALELDKKGCISSSSDKDDVEYPDQKIEIKNQNNANTVKVKQTKAPKEKTLAKNAIKRDEDNPKKEKPKKDSKEVNKESRRIRSRINKEMKNVVSIFDKDIKKRNSKVTRKEVSDTELNKRDEPTPCKSYVSDTELTSKKMVRQSKIKMKRNNKDIKKCK